MRSAQVLRAAAVTAVRFFFFVGGGGCVDRAESRSSTEDLARTAAAAAVEAASHVLGGTTQQDRVQAAGKLGAAAVQVRNDDAIGHDERYHAEESNARRRELANHGTPVVMSATQQLDGGSAGTTTGGATSKLQPQGNSWAVQDDRGSQDTTAVLARKQRGSVPAPIGAVALNVRLKYDEISTEILVGWLRHTFIFS